MDNDRTKLANLLGAFALGLTDLIVKAAAAQTGHGGETPSALVILGAEPGLRIAALAAALGLSHPGAVRLVDRLVADGLVERGRAADGRAVALRLTRDGEARRTAMLSARANAIEPLLADLPAADLQSLYTTLNDLLVRLTTDEARAYAICRLCDEDVCVPSGCPVETAAQERA